MKNLTIRVGHVKTRDPGIDSGRANTQQSRGLSGRVSVGPKPLDEVRAAAAVEEVMSDSRKIA
jgi:hypothetical protein